MPSNKFRLFVGFIHFWKMTIISFKDLKSHFLRFIAFDNRMKSYTKIYLPNLPAYCKWNFYSVNYFILFINELIRKARHDWIENSRRKSMIICFSLKTNLSKRLQAFNLLPFFSKTEINGTAMLQLMFMYWEIKTFYDFSK